MTKFAPLAALAILPVLGVLFSTPVFADSPGQLSNGPANYKVRNVTKNGAYAQSVAATCDETVKYSITLSNSDFGLLRDLTVKANMTSGDITASAVNAANATTSVSGNAKVTVDKGTLAYVPGSTVRISSDNSTREGKADGITAGGVNVGNLNGSTAIFVQFEAKVNCPAPEAPEVPVVPVKPEAPKAPVAPVAPKAAVVVPAELPRTGSEGVIAIVASLLAAAAGYIVTARKNVLG